MDLERPQLPLAVYKTAFQYSLILNVVLFLVSIVLMIIYFSFATTNPISDSEILYAKAYGLKVIDIPTVSKGHKPSQDELRSHIAKYRQNQP